MSRTWDEGVRWFSRCAVAPRELPLGIGFVTERVLKSPNGDAEDALIESFLSAATAAAEEATQRALMPQTWAMVLDRFPCSGRIVLERPPLIDFPTINYYDADGAEQTLSGSPAQYRLRESGKHAKAEVWPLEDETFPETACRPDAVTVTYRAGYEYADRAHPEFQQITTGIGLMVAELYKNPTLSVHAVHNTPAVLNLAHFWRRVW